MVGLPTPSAEAHDSTAQGSEILLVDLNQVILPSSGPCVSIQAPFSSQWTWTQDFHFCHTLTDEAFAESPWLRVLL